MAISTGIAHTRFAGASLLLVDDCENIRRIAVRSLRNRGYEVMAAATPREALAVFQQERCSIDLILTDVMMPEMSGPQMVQLLRQVRGDIRVLYLSGCDPDLIRGDLDDDPLAAFLLKPFSLQQLADTVLELLPAERAVG